MNRIFHPYLIWEDFQNGMYEIPSKEREPELIERAISVLSDAQIFRAACNSVIINWPICTENNLTNPTCNRKAWLGQAACNILHSVPEICTRLAWGMLTEQQREIANDVAKSIIDKYEAENS